MIVKKKTREESAVEKRNTAITTFILVALLPMAICILVGFSIGKTKESNFTNFETSLLDLKEQNMLLVEEAHNLGTVFIEMDSLLNIFLLEGSTGLRTKLQGILPKDHIAFKKWDDQVDELVDDFELDYNDFGRPFVFTAGGGLDLVRARGKSWLEKINKIEENSLYLMREMHSQRTGAADCDALQAQIGNLEDELLRKDIELITIRNASSSVSNASTQQCETDLQLQQQKLKQFISQNLSVQQSILSQLDIIDDIISNMEASGLLSNRRELNNKIEDVGQELVRLRTESGKLVVAIK